MDTLYIVIPAYNEEENIESVTKEWHAIVSKIGGNSSLLIIDDGSKDNTYQKLLELKKELPFLQPITKTNSGHGGTVLYGYSYAIDKGADYVFQTDSDGQTIADEFWPLWEQRENYDIQIGHRKGRQDGFSRVFVTKTLKLVLLLTFGLWIKDANTPFRLMSAESLKKYLPKIPVDYNLSNVLLTVLYEKSKERIKYIPITFRPRQGGINSINFKKIIKIGQKALKDFAKLRTHI
ncbi:MAG: glycosyltransferase family 2 protein [Eubacteriaceae bacterium]